MSSAIPIVDFFKFIFGVKSIPPIRRTEQNVTSILRTFLEVHDFLKSCLPVGTSLKSSCIRCSLLG
jgi:hypothetical protein